MPSCSPYLLDFPVDSARKVSSSCCNPSPAYFVLIEVRSFASVLREFCTGFCAHTDLGMQHRQGMKNAKDHSS
jgi:hypothetical protein